MLSNSLLEKELGKLYLIRRSSNRYDAVVRISLNLTDANAASRIGSDSTNPVSTGTDDCSSGILGDGDLSCLLFALVIDPGKICSS